MHNRRLANFLISYFHFLAPGICSRLSIVASRSCTIDNTIELWSSLLIVKNIYPLVAKLVFLNIV